MVPSGASSSQSSPAYYTICCCSSFRFLIEAENLLDGFVYLATLAVEKFVLILGPLLICFASAIIVGLSWTFFTVVLPMMQHRYQDSPYRYWILGIHVGFVSFLLVQIVFNYFMCVMTPNKGPNYEAVVRELAVATRFDYPESPQAVEQFRREHEDKMIIRMKRRQLREMEDEKQNAKSSTMASNTSGASTSSTTPTSATSTTTTTGTLSLDVPPAESATKITKRNKKQTKQTMTNSIRASQPTPKQIRNWMLMAPDEWGYCQRSRQAKPPRSHYDHVTKTLVLCLDHYCPWMFNAVGYFNYRYFCNFLLFVDTGMFYGAAITYRPFRNLSGPLYRSQFQEFRKTRTWTRLYPMVPFAKDRLAISLSFMLCLAIGIAVACLGGFHLYLLLTGQTTIEFHGNFVNKRKAARLDKKFKNPYDLGYKRNFQQVYGTQNVFKALFVPSRREPEFLPLPMSGEEGKRVRYRCRTSADDDTVPLKGNESIV